MTKEMTPQTLVQTWNTYPTALDGDGGNLPVPAPFTCPGNAGMMTKLIKVGTGNRDKMYVGSAWSEIGAEVQKEGMASLCPGPSTSSK